MSLAMLLDASSAIETAPTLLSIANQPRATVAVPTKPEKLRIVVNRDLWQSEIEKGIPEDFKAMEVTRFEGDRVDKYYFSPRGLRFRSVKAVLRSL